jgi:putative transposase
VRRNLRCDGKFLSPERCRRAVHVLRARFRAMERFACRVVDQHRSTQHHGGKLVDLEEAKLRRRLREIAVALRRTSAGTGGWSTACCCGEGWAVNHKRVHRLWREEGRH